jgi:hypothetical protein
MRSESKAFSEDTSGAWPRGHIEANENPAMANEHLIFGYFHLSDSCLV